MFQPIEVQTERVLEEIKEVHQLRETLQQNIQVFMGQQSRVDKLTEKLELAVSVSQDTLQKIKEKEKGVSEEEVKQNEN